MQNSIPKTDVTKKEQPAASETAKTSQPEISRLGQASVKQEQMKNVPEFLCKQEEALYIILRAPHQHVSHLKHSLLP